MATCDDSLQRFIFSFQCYAHETCRFEETRGKILKLQNDLVELLRRFKEGGNCTEVGKVDDSQNSTATPMKVGLKAHFIRVTPKSDIIPSLPCEYCDKKYQMLRSLRRHIKEEHPKENFPEGLSEPPDYVTCKMCWRKIKRDKISTHLISVHKCVKPDPSSLLRGFVSFDRKNWRPLWLPKHVESPPDVSEASIQISNGKFYYYGGVFAAEDFNCEVVEEDFGNVDAEGLKDVVLVPVSQVESASQAEMSILRATEDEKVGASGSGQVECDGGREIVKTSTYEVMNSSQSSEEATFSFVDLKNPDDFESVPHSSNQSELCRHYDKIVKTSTYEVTNSSQSSEEMTFSFVDLKNHDDLENVSHSSNLSELCRRYDMNPTPTADEAGTFSGNEDLQTVAEDILSSQNECTEASGVTLLKDDTLTDSESETEEEIEPDRLEFRKLR